MAITVGASTITMNSGSVLQDPPGGAPSFLPRAWVRYLADGAVLGSGNVTSVTSLTPSGRYQVNFTTAMPDVNYAVVCVTEQAINSNSQEVRSLQVNAEAFPTTTNVTLLSKRTIVGGATADIGGPGYVAIFR